MPEAFSDQNNGNRLEATLARRGTEQSFTFTLDRIQKALGSVGNPHQNVKTFVIAGTNGKGSTSLYLSSILVEAGFRVGTFLSPHLMSPTERLIANLTPISESVLYGLACELSETADQFHLSYFEFLTLICFVWASRWNPDFLVLEVGMGGRLDATNVANPLASLVTTIGLDHMEFLGSTEELILEEKLGILRPESLLFSGVRQPQLKKRIEAVCDGLDTIYYHADGLKVSDTQVSLDGQSFKVNGYPIHLKNPAKGNQESAVLAFLAARILFPRLPVSTLQQGLANVCNPGRLETVQTSPRVILSGDHNHAGINNLLETLASIPEKVTHILCGFSPSKPANQMIACLRQLGAPLTLVPVPGLEYPDLLSYSQLAHYQEDTYRALDAILNEAKPTDTILVTGSLYLVGALSRRWKSGIDFRVTGTVKAEKDLQLAAPPRESPTLWPADLP